MNRQADTTNTFRTVLTITAGLLVFYLIFWADWLLYTSIIVGLAGALSSLFAKWIHRAWMGLAWLLGMIIPPIVLALIYYTVLVPVALVSRIFRKEKPLIIENDRKSFFKESNRTFSKKDFKNPW